MKRVEDEDRPSAHAALARESGFTGLSILCRLHSLYGFDILQDLVYDAMHNVPLNVGSHHLHHYFDDDILSKQAVEKRLKDMPWTKGKYLCTACMPVNNHKYGHPYITS